MAKTRTSYVKQIPQHIQTYIGDKLKKRQPKIPLTFLFDRLHFNTVLAEALFQGGHVLMRNKRCAVQTSASPLAINSYWLLPDIYVYMCVAERSWGCN